MTELTNALQSHNVFDSESELILRKKILKELGSLLNQWIRDVSAQVNTSSEPPEKMGGKIYPFGSYRLGVHQRGADIDALCVAPQNINRSDFFNSFFVILKKQPQVTECRAIEEAFAPVIKMKFCGIEIDLLFARLSLPIIPDNLNLRDNKLLLNMDPKSIRSLNGCRVADEILSLVPNIDSFRLALRTIKLWAKKQGIYSNSLGYFGGVTWCLLVAHTCQLYPKATATTLVQKFFATFSNWKWPNPVIIKPRGEMILSLPVSQKVWDPRLNASDRYHLMPVITPSYPQQNSTFNVSKSTKQIIVDKLNQGMAITQDIITSSSPWGRLFDTPKFFLK